MQSYRIYFTVAGRNMRPLFVGRRKGGEMNKKQLKVVWVALGTIILVIIFAPTYRLVPYEGKYIRITKVNPKYNGIATQVAWDKVLQYSVPILLVAIFLFYSLRNQKK